MASLASLLLKSARPDLAAAVQQPLARLSPGRVPSVELDCIIEPLDLDGPPAAPAFDLEQFAYDLRQPHLPEPWPSGRCGSRRRSAICRPQRERRCDISL